MFVLEYYSKYYNLIIILSENNLSIKIGTKNLKIYTQILEQHSKINVPLSIEKLSEYKYS